MKIIAEKHDRNEWDVTAADGEWLGTLACESIHARAIASHVATRADTPIR